MGEQPYDEGGRNRRSTKNLLIYPQFQIPLIVFNLGALGLSLLVFWVTSQKVLGDLEPAAKLSGVEIDFFRKYLQYHSRQLHIMFAVSGFITLLVSFVSTLVLSHKIAGPMVALRHYFRKVKDGVQPMPRLKFRDFDFLQDIPPLINEAIEALVARLSGARKSA
jgi:hypothetical protein